MKQQQRSTKGRTNGIECKQLKSKNAKKTNLPQACQLGIRENSISFLIDGWQFVVIHHLFEHIRQPLRLQDHQWISIKCWRIGKIFHLLIIVVAEIPVVWRKRRWRGYSCWSWCCSGSIHFIATLLNNWFFIFIISSSLDIEMKQHSTVMHPFQNILQIIHQKIAFIHCRFHSCFKFIPFHEWFSMLCFRFTLHSLHFLFHFPIASGKRLSNMRKVFASSLLENIQDLLIECLNDWLQLFDWCFDAFIHMSANNDEVSSSCSHLNWISIRNKHGKERRAEHTKWRKESSIRRGGMKSNQIERPTSSPTTVNNAYIQ